MIIYVRGESVMTFIEWLKDCNEADPLTKKVYICNDYLNAERMLENASGENIVIRLEDTQSQIMQSILSKPVPSIWTAG